MKSTRAIAASVDGYLAALPDAVQTRMARIRAQIRKAVPRASESISYAIPAYKLEGKPLIYFASFKAHIGLYPIDDETKRAFAHELATYAQSKGTVRFPHDRPIPYALIGSIAKHRARAILAAQTGVKMATKAKASKAASPRTKGSRA